MPAQGHSMARSLCISFFASARSPGVCVCGCCSPGSPPGAAAGSKQAISTGPRAHSLAHDLERERGWLEELKPDGSKASRLRKPGEAWQLQHWWHSCPTSLFEPECEANVHELCRSTTCEVGCSGKARLWRGSSLPGLLKCASLLTFKGSGKV